MRLRSLTRWLIAAVACIGFVAAAVAEPWAAPGNMRLRNDLQLLNDSGVINMPLTAWPVPWGDIATSLADVSASELPPQLRTVYERVRRNARDELDVDLIIPQISLAAGSNPRIIRTFENTAREEVEISAGASWVGERFALNLAVAYVGVPLDGDDFRADGSYVGLALGNWMLSAGWQERWWGPGRDGSMILSTNARPMPGVALQRIGSIQSESKWFHWIGPWTLTTFMSMMDDERHVENGLLWGLRGSFRPLRGFEIGISRTAQWCGDDRPCDLKTFLRMLNGNDNEGANVDPEDEPGNQLGGIDMRWALPRQIPLALYMQWTAEDTRQTGGSLHKWLRQGGVEYWGTVGDFSHRLHFEIADTTCRFGAFGEASAFPDCAYNHGIFKTGYRYNGRSIGHGMDSDGLSYTLGATLVQSAGHSWNVSLRFIEINRAGEEPDTRHTLAESPQDLADIQVSYDRMFALGRIYVGAGYSQLDDKRSETTQSEGRAFIRWSLY